MAISPCHFGRAQVGDLAAGAVPAIGQVERDRDPDGDDVGPIT